MAATLQIQPCARCGPCQACLGTLDKCNCTTRCMPVPIEMQGAELGAVLVRAWDDGGFCRPRKEHPCTIQRRYEESETENHPSSPVSESEDSAALQSPVAVPHKFSHPPPAHTPPHTELHSNLSRRQRNGSAARGQHQCWPRKRSPCSGLRDDMHQYACRRLQSFPTPGSCTRTRPTRAAWATADQARASQAVCRSKSIGSARQCSSTLSK
mmetsp:Transcript_60443/g.91151  ORF Transcript_60443/g.91151 Transcript_60443/m.91151 type:complete len:211 (-) Transcript_60443:387-1019(-)